MLLLAFAVKLLLLFQGDPIGRDYSYFYPKLAAYQYWMERNGFFSIPHFLPYMCAGIFDFAAPTSFYPSFPTLALLVLPFAWVWPATVVAFGAIGFAGGYVLARHALRVGPMAALVCGAVILFNGFYASRMAVGHVSFHGFMLLPWIAALCVVRGGSGWLSSRSGIACTGLAMAYLVHSGGIYLIIPSAISTLAIVVAASASARDLALGALRYLAGGIAGALISAPKIIESLHLMSHFPRDHYLLPGFSGPLEALQFLATSLFYWPSLKFLGAHLMNTQFVFEIHEAVFHISVLPLAAAALFVAARFRNRDGGRSMAGAARYAILFLLLAVPVALNVYEPHWNQFLKKVPVLGQSVYLIRYFCAYIVPLAAFTAWVFDRAIRANSLRPPFLIAVFAIPLCGFLALDLSQFTQRGYDPRTIVKAFAADGSRARRPIVAVTAFREHGDIVRRLGGDDLLVQGLSQLACYEPVFGYRLEKFPTDNLPYGRADELIDGAYNFRNPACYVFPALNQCRPGDRFRVGQEKDLAVFLDYGPLEYHEPDYLRTARILSWVVLLVALVGAFLPAAAAARPPRKRYTSSFHPDP